MAERLHPRRLVLILAVLTCLASAGCQVDNKHVVTFEFDGLQRTYTIHVSALYVGTTPAPLLIALHGMDQTGDDVKSLTGYDALADTLGFLFVYPDAYESNWNDARAVPGMPAYDLDVDDVGFIKAVIDRVKADYNVDAARVYLVGVSNGGMMAHRMACEAPERFAAIASAMGAVPENLAAGCAPSVPVPMIIISGTADPLVPYNGGALISDGQNLGNVLSAQESVALWVENNAATTPPTVIEEPDLAPNDGTRAYREEYAAGPDGAEVTFYRIEGGGHTWPGGPLWQVLLGPVCRDINASTVVWNFFTQHTRQ